jgi:hypothetical protein
VDLLAVELFVCSYKDALWFSIAMQQKQQVVKKTNQNGSVNRKFTDDNLTPYDIISHAVDELMDRR